MSSLVKYFYLSPMHCDSSRVLEVLDFRTYDRARLGLGYLRPGASNQLWAFIPREDGFYEIINKHSKKVLDDSNLSTHPGGTVYQFNRHLSPNQQWRIKGQKTRDAVNILSRCGNLTLDVRDWSQEHYAEIILWHCGDCQPNQMWRLIRA